MFRARRAGITSHFQDISFTDSSRKNARVESGWRSVVGLEIHAQIQSMSKLFSASATKYGSPINTQVSFFDAALPGTLPVLNRECVAAGVLTALALNCHVNQVSKFDRKHYFYADLPAGYQITQQRQPLAVGGEVDYMTVEPNRKLPPTQRKVRLIQLQLEQDSGKSLHDPTGHISLIDLNRAGVGLMEIVTEPDFNNGEDAAAFVKELQLILQTLGTCDGKMAEGSLRVDANISVHRPGEPLGVKSEVKNINSTRGVAKAINFEIKRHISELEAGREIVNETRSFESHSGKTVAMRDKERLIDYRFMPEPNLPPLHVYSTVPDQTRPQVILIDQVQATMPELPAQTRSRLQEQYGLSLSVVLTLINERMVSYFETVMKEKTRDAKSVANLLVNELLGQLNSLSRTFPDSPISTEQFGELYDMFQRREVSFDIVRKVLGEMSLHPDSNPRRIVTANDWFQIQDVDRLTPACEEAVQQQQRSVEEYKRGNYKSIRRLVNHVQRNMEHRADPVVVIQILKNLMD
ncbi:glutamyl-tRNA(Gln) amidotransferase subunit B, mitochondrial-like isoform X1 [Haliotis rubra]|uniref:glutamyl-tRNA(Gln) amidotransferase subunit B, mitochondrial-like isoform X1 n=1 Tax=Haliotis rubra TaxID=36100 RepID=UPI001EE54D33|nr:glutamyl-tRNA(Gln) amidotransferase subunit B, mitochondrial-like isoform X1 [Haliotis rubra]